MDGSNGERKARDALRDERERDAFAAVPRERTHESERGEMCEQKSTRNATKRDRNFKRRRKARVLLSVRRDAITRDRYGPDERKRERVVRRPF